MCSNLSQQRHYSKVLLMDWFCFHWMLVLRKKRIALPAQFGGKELFLLVVTSPCDLINLIPLVKNTTLRAFEPCFKKANVRSWNNDLSGFIPWCSNSKFKAILLGSESHREPRDPRSPTAISCPSSSLGSRLSTDWPFLRGLPFLILTKEETASLNMCKSLKMLVWIQL